MLFVLALKTVQSNLAATGSLVVGNGVTIAAATGVTATFASILVNLGGTVSEGVSVSSFTVNAASSDTDLGKISAKAIGTAVTLTTTPTLGYKLVIWKE